MGSAWRLLVLLVLAMVTAASSEWEEVTPTSSLDITEEKLWPLSEGTGEAKWPPSDIVGGLWPQSREFFLQMEEFWEANDLSGIQGLHELLLPDDEGNERTDKKGYYQKISGIYLPSTDPDIVENEQCRHDVASVIQVLDNPKLQGQLAGKGHFWYSFLSDSWAKLPDGMLEGNIHPWGMMEECTMLNVHEFINNTDFLLDTTFDGQYCLISYRHIPSNNSAHPSEEMEKNGIEMFMGPVVKGAMIPPLFHYGTCMPSTCTAHDLTVSLNEKLRPSRKEVKYVDCQTENSGRTPDAKDITGFVVLAILGFLVLAGAIADISINYWNLQPLRKGPLRYLLAFSGYTNLSKMFAINTKENPEIVSCLHGIRVLSMVWVVWGHGYMFLVPVTMNLLGVEPLTDDLIDQTVVNATFSVDTFFFMSGLLVAYGCLKEYSRVGRINWILYYVHRIIRLTPPILITGAFMATAGRFFLVGPYGPTIERSAVAACRERWWADAIYITNFINGRPCLPQCWYTAVDSQIYLVLPLVLVPLIYKPKIGVAWLAVVTAVSFAIPTIIYAVYDAYPALNFAITPTPPDRDIDTYTTPWCRASVYIVGIWAGWILHHMRERKITMKAWQAIVGWVLAFALGLLVIYGIYDYNTLNPDVRKPLTDAVSIIYGGFSRGAWAVALLWLVVACHAGYGGPINTFLSHPSWQPLSRLTYSMYLTSLSFQVLYMGSIYMPLYVNHLNKIMETLGYLFISGLVSVALSLMTEGPVLGLEKILIKRPGRGTEEAKPRTNDTAKT